MTRIHKIAPCGHRTADDQVCAVQPIPRSGASLPQGGAMVWRSAPNPSRYCSTESHRDKRSACVQPSRPARDSGRSLRLGLDRTTRRQLDARDPARRVRPHAVRGERVNRLPDLCRLLHATSTASITIAEALPARTSCSTRGRDGTGGAIGWRGTAGMCTGLDSTCTVMCIGLGAQDFVLLPAWHVSCRSTGGADRSVPRRRASCKSAEAPW